MDESGPFTLEYLVDDIDGTVSALDGPFVVVGQSIAAPIAELVAARHPTRALGLVLLTPVPLAGTHLPPGFLESFRSLGGNPQAQRAARQQLAAGLADAAGADHGAPERAGRARRELSKRLEEVQAEREELVIAERALHRLAEQDRGEAEAAAVAPVKAQVAGRVVLLIPHRGDDPDETALPGDYRKILAIVGVADGPVQVRTVGEELGLEVAVRGKLEPLRAKMTKLADRG
ncbi:alpha/beta hydrolase [Streptomyces sp. NPDC007162]|uniref:alpha/beta fold hydrolase n=1 Tax=Streptomyces sp. NPDC007162 TaxID=3156917 RepID=UPI0034053A7C